MKTCPLCQKSFELSLMNFQRRHRSADGYDCYCKSCRADTRRAWLAKNPDYYVRYNYANRDKLSNQSRVRNAAQANKRRKWRRDNRSEYNDYNRRYRNEVDRYITREEREAAGDFRRKPVRMADGTIGRVIGRRNDLWLVLLPKPIIISRTERQRVVQVRTLQGVGE